MLHVSTFHFSPRANRAGEIKWRPWNEDSFRLARETDRPVLLSISATWCGWCHAMDEETYSDDRVIRRINDGFVPIRVDSDRRPDIDSRYNMGGWPTTVFLTPDARLITGATYVPPDSMVGLLDEVTRLYREVKT